jgi:aminoacyl-tRNA hydrolase
VKLRQTPLLLKQQWHRISAAIEWRLRSRLGDNTVDGAIYRAGLHVRPYLKRAVFFGIAGSVGKTTAKDLLVGILASRGKTIGNPVSLNAAPEVARTVLRVRPWHRYCVVELGETAPGSLDKHLAVLHPTIGAITNVGDDHFSAFGSHEAIASEFAKLAQALPADGCLILNRDDERVFALRHQAACRVITFGQTPGADLLASDISSVWPGALRFTVTFNGERQDVQTQLYGRHLLTSVLAAIGSALAAGLTLGECAHGIAAVTPPQGRMQRVCLPGDITYICDDYKAPAWTVGALLDQLGEAKARRKIFVLGTISDCHHTPIQTFKFAKRSLEVADIAIFTGRYASAALKAKQPDNEGRLYAFSHIRDIALFLESTRQPGDLIVLKGSNNKDHLSRLALSLSQPVNCWLNDCEREMFCSNCSHLESQRTSPGTRDTTPANAPTETLPIVGPDDQIVIGLGNPDPKFTGSPHNAGHAALDQFCTAIGSIWRNFPEAWIAQGKIENRLIWQIKPNVPMNLIGPTLKNLADAMQFTAAQCVLLFDDMDLPLGKIRIRMNGSAGGHRGVASILDAFQTDRFRRIKIGVRPQTAPANLVEYVVTPLGAEDSAIIAKAIKETTKQLQAVLIPQS